MLSLDEFDKLSTEEYKKLIGADDDFKWTTTKEILAQQFPIQEWLIDRVIPIEGFTIIAGPEACGKSFYTLSIANSLATGSKWLDQFPVFNSVKTLFIDKENTTRRTNSRLKGLDITDPEGKLFWLKYPEKFTIYDGKGKLSDFSRDIKEKVIKEEIKLVIVDSMTDIIVGSENSQGDTQAMFDALRQLFPGISVLLLHHISKPAAGVNRSSGQKFRGSSNINAQIYSGFLVEPIIGTVNEFAIEQVKSGDSPKLPKFKVNLVTQVDKETNKSYISEIKYCGEIEDAEAKTVEGMKLVNQAFEGVDELSRQELMAILGDAGISSRTAERILKTLINSEELETKRDGRKTIYYKPDGANLGYVPYSDD
jgi:hypothetical protein